MSSIEPVGVQAEVVDVTSASWAYSNATAGRRPVAIHCNAQSTIVGALMNDAAESTWVLPLGTSEYAFKSINTTSTTKTGIKIIYG